MAKDDIIPACDHFIDCEICRKRYNEACWQRDTAKAYTNHVRGLADEISDRLGVSHLRGEEQFKAAIAALDKAGFKAWSKAT